MVKKADNNGAGLPDFSNTEIAFAAKSDAALKKAARLFGTMNKKWLVDLSAPLGLTAMKWKLPFVKWIAKATIFDQFVGGTTLLNTTPVINKLYESNVLTILDYGAEGRDTEKGYNQSMNEFIRAIEFAATNESTPVVVVKISSLTRHGLLVSIQNGESLNKETRREYRNLLKRIDSICHVSTEQGVSVFFDAEESWIQNTIDHLVLLMMRRYNQERVVVYNTYQMYRHDRLQFLIDNFSYAEDQHFMLGAKLVRGAYMDKERDRAQEMGYKSPIQVDKAATDDGYNMALRFCLDNYEKIAVCNATHNQESCLLMARLMEEKGIPRDHPHTLFCQLYGMSDHLTFNLAHAGYLASKYVPYGLVEDVFPYLVRRAQENTAVVGDMSREYGLVKKEMDRRKAGEL